MAGGNWKDMFKAVQEGDIALVDYYLKTEVDPNYQHPEFMASPLVESIRFNQLEICKLLLENNCKPNIKEDLGGDTPMSVAKAKNNNDVIILLKKYLD